MEPEQYPSLEKNGRTEWKANAIRGGTSATTCLRFTLLSKIKKNGVRLRVATVCTNSERRRIKMGAKTIVIDERMNMNKLSR